MSLAPRTQLGSYEIVKLLGAGGMGEVYQASDTRLRRQVAIKILPEAFARDTERVARFEREARVLASLNHPHIAAIHGLEESGGRIFLVMELVEGQTLAEKLGRGFPLNEACSMAIQIADALEAAHERGVIHRDLKPANIKVTPGGQVKLLDFGLAKAFTEESSAPDLSNSPTLTISATNPGVILGTAAYMSPEQAKGQDVDRRTDIFAFGCVFYEMLTGHRAFAGNSVSEILARVIERDPDWTKLPDGLHPRIQDALRRCLEKDPRKRRRDIGDVRLEIEHALTDPVASAQPVAQGRYHRTSGLAWTIAALLAVALAGLAGVTYFRTPPNPSEMRVEITTPPTPDPFSLAISPDGRHVTFVALANGQPQLWVRSLDAATAQPLTGTEGAAYPFWSPDSRSIGFFAGNNKLRRIDINGGSPQSLADVAPGFGGSWGPDGTILFAPNIANALFRVPASGGQPAAVTKLLTPQQTSHRFPQFLPDGRQFLYFVDGTPDAQGIYVGSLDSPEGRRLTPSDTFGVYVASGWLLFGRQGRLVAQRLDPVTPTLSGDVVTIAESIGINDLRLGAFSAAGGLLAYRAARASTRQLTWFDRTGKQLGTVGPRDGSEIADPEISPDGQRVAVNRRLENDTDVWILDATRATRLTFEPSVEHMAIWSPDGNQLVFGTDRKGAFDIYQKSSISDSPEAPSIETSLLKRATDWSPDGRFLMYFTIANPQDGPDLWVQPLVNGRPDPSTKPFSFLSTNFGEVWGQFSPDGRWILYQSNESGRWNVYVRPFPGSGGRWSVSSDGGVYPRWGPGGREVYYVAPDGAFMAAPLTVKGAVVEVGTPVRLFRSQILGGGVNLVGRRQQYDVAPDGRFLVNVDTEATVTSPITIILNWNEGR